MKIIGSRGTKTVVIHEGYKPELLDRSYNDIALIKFDRPFFPETVTEAKMMPICLPPSSAFTDEDKQGGMTYCWPSPGQVLRWVLAWRNNQFAGLMELVQKSTKNVQGRLFTHTRVHIWNLTFHQYSLSFKFNSGEKPRTFKLVHNQCITFKSPAMGHGEPCYYFHREPRTNKYVSRVHIRFYFNQPKKVSDRHWRSSLASKGKRQEICYELHPQRHSENGGGENVLLSSETLS